MHVNALSDKGMTSTVKDEINYDTFFHDFSAPKIPGASQQNGVTES